MPSSGLSHCSCQGPYLKRGSFDPMGKEKDGQHICVLKGKLPEEIVGKDIINIYQVPSWGQAL